MTVPLFSELQRSSLLVPLEILDMNAIPSHDEVQLTKWLNEARAFAATVEAFYLMGVAMWTHATGREAVRGNDEINKL
jgi:hypothetical protein